MAGKRSRSAVAVVTAFLGLWMIGGFGPAGRARVAAAPAGGTSPVESYKRQVIRDAMRGLRYDSGRVRPDPENSRALGGSRGRAAAAERFARGEFLLRGRNDVIGAVSAFTEAVLLAHEEPRFHEGLGRALSALGKRAEAEAAFRTALDLDAGLVGARYDLAALLYAYGRRGEAIAEWNRILARDPGAAESHRRLALAYYYAGDLVRSRAHAREAESLGRPLPPQFHPRPSSPPPPRVVPAAAGEVVVGPQVRVDAGGGTSAANETSIATTSVDPNEVVATWNDWRETTGPDEVVRVGVAVSLDGGGSWADFLVRAPAGHRSSVEGDPMTAYDPRTGALWIGGISFTSNGGLFVARKQPGSAQFDPSVQVGQLSFADKGWMAAGPPPGNPNWTNVYIADNEGVWRSTNMGASWQGPVFAGFGAGFLPRVGPGGELYVAYWDGFDGNLLRKSTDGGQSFGPAVPIATRMDPWGSQDGSRFPGRFRVPPFLAFAVDPAAGTLYAVYPDTTNVVGGNANVDLYFTRSTDGGGSWSTPVALPFDAILTGDQFFPWIEVDDAGTLHMVFYDSHNTAQNDDDENGFFDAYYAMSTDGGATWSRFRLTPAPFNSIDDGLDRGTSQFIGDYLGLAFGGNKVYPCYLSTQNGDSDIFVHSVTVSGPAALALAPPDPGQAGMQNTIAASGAVPGERVFFAASRNPGSKPVGPCPGLLLDLQSPKRLGKATAAADGTATLGFFVPNRVSGVTVLFQAVAADRCVKSDVLSFTFP